MFRYLSEIYLTQTTFDKKFCDEDISGFEPQATLNDLKETLNYH